MQKKKSKKLLIVLGVLLLAVLAAAVFAFVNKEEKQQKDLLNISKISDAVLFLESKGWKVEECPSECRTFTVPEEFSPTLMEYNELQKAQNFDLSSYCGKSVTIWSFVVTNYPGYSDDGKIRANVICYNGRIIGGDICSTEISGFMHGFDKTGVKNGENKT